MKNLFFCLTIISFFSSCSGHLKIIPKGCYSKNKAHRWALDFDNNYEADFRITKRVWTRGWASENSEAKHVYLKKFLGEHGVKCEKIKNMKISVTQSSKDIFVSVVPWMNRHTVTVEGMFN